MFRRNRRVPWLLLLALLCVGFAAASASADALVIPADPAAVGANAYYGDASLQAVVLQEGIVSIGSKAFANSSLKDISLPSTLTSIADDAFDGAPLETVHAEKGTYAYRWMREKGYIAEYRALLIGEQRFLWFADETNPEGGHVLDDQDQRNVEDVYNLTDAFGSVIGPDGAYGAGGKPYQVVQKFNLSYGGIRNAITNTFADTMDQDISVFFIATHGHETGDGELYTAFTGNFANIHEVTDYWQHRMLPFDVLASWLKDNVRGRVFVILESCGSGSSIYDENVPENKAKAGAAQADGGAAEQFLSKAVEAFAKADPGIPVPKNHSAVPESFRSTGDLRLPKFYVLAASAHHEKSYGWEDDDDPEDSYNFFTGWLIEGIGSPDNSPADKDGNGYLNLNELFAYIQQYDHVTVDDVDYYQHVQRYPADSADNLLKLEEPFSYTVTDVAGSPHAAGSGEDVVITVSRNPRDEETYGRFESVFADEYALEPDSYAKAKGSLVLTLKSSRMDELSEGEHTITVRFSDGEAQTDITVTGAQPTPTPEPTATPRPVPVTGDSGRPALWLGLALLGLAGLSAAGIRRGAGKRRK